MKTRIDLLIFTFLTLTSAANAAEERPLRTDVESAAGLRNVYSLDCSQTRDGKPGYLCWYRDDNTNALGAFVRVEKGWFGWNKIDDD